MCRSCGVFTRCLREDARDGVRYRGCWHHALLNARLVDRLLVLNRQPMPLAARHCSVSTCLVPQTQTSQSLWNLRTEYCASCSTDISTPISPSHCVGHAQKSDLVFTNHKYVRYSRRTTGNWSLFKLADATRIGCPYG